MITLLRVTAGALLFLSASGAALASDGYITDDVTLFAGPDDDYPEIAYVPAGTLVQIWGCVDGYAWCDISVDADRGWVPGETVQYEYRDRWVSVHEYGPSIGLPIVAFALGTYWGQHYNHYGWYHDHDNWAHSKHGYRPHGTWQTHYVPVHHYDQSYRLPSHYYTNVHHSNPYWNDSRHGGHDSNHHNGSNDHYSGSGHDYRGDSHGQHDRSYDHDNSGRDYHGDSRGQHDNSDRHGSSYVNHSEPADHHNGQSTQTQHAQPQQGSSYGQHQQSQSQHHSNPQPQQDSSYGQHQTSQPQHDSNAQAQHQALPRAQYNPNPRVQTPNPQAQPAQQAPQAQQQQKSSSKHSDKEKDKDKEH